MAEDLVAQLYHAQRQSLEKYAYFRSTPTFCWQAAQQGFAFRWQYTMLIAGAAFYIEWQVLEMAIKAGLA